MLMNKRLGVEDIKHAFGWKKLCFYSHKEVMVSYPKRGSTGGVGNHLKII